MPTISRRPLRPFNRPQSVKAWPCSLVDAEMVPVYINNRNRLASMRQLVEWLLDAGTKRITIIDNNSSYQPLLYYYDSVPEGVGVERLTKNIGPYAFWELKMYGRQMTPFIVTDADMVPDKDCPKDLVRQMNTLLYTHPEFGKVGVGLRIDDIPDLSMSEKLNGWEFEEQRPYWKHRYSEQAFYAPVDTTFAIYADGNPTHSQKIQSWKNLRMDFPYVFRHMPWYITLENMSEEETYYRTHTEIGPHGAAHPWSHNHQLLEPRDAHPWKDNPR